LRDYQYALQETNPTKDLENLLRVENAINKKEIEETKFIHDSIKRSFRSLECFYFPFPIDSGIDGMTYEETMRNLDRVNLRKLRSEFIDQGTSLHESIKTKSEPKSISSIPLLAQDFSKYIETVVDSLNDNKLIPIIDSSISSLKYVFEQNLKNALKDYETNLDAELNTEILLDWINFEDKAKNITETHKNNLKTALNSEHALAIQFLQEFDKKVGELNEKKKREHVSRIKTYYKNELSSIWKILEYEKEILVMDKNTGERFKEARKELIKRYEGLYEVKPEKNEIFKEWCEKELDKFESQLRNASMVIKSKEEENFLNRAFYGSKKAIGLITKLLRSIR
jgi:hypothetical protein